MLLLTSTSDLVRVITGEARTVDVFASFIDFNGTSATPGRTNTLITTATTTTVVASPGASVQRNVKTLNIRNKDASAATITVIHTDGTTVVELYSLLLAPNSTIQHVDGMGWLEL